MGLRTTGHQPQIPNLASTDKTQQTTKNADTEGSVNGRKVKFSLSALLSWFIPESVVNFFKGIFTRTTKQAGPNITQGLSVKPDEYNTHGVAGQKASLVSHRAGGSVDPDDGTLDEYHDAQSFLDAEDGYSDQEFDSLLKKYAGKNNCKMLKESMGNLNLEEDIISKLPRGMDDVPLPSSFDKGLATAKRAAQPDPTPYERVRAFLDKPLAESGITYCDAALLMQDLRQAKARTESSCVEGMQRYGIDEPLAESARLPLDKKIHDMAEGYLKEDITDFNQPNKALNNCLELMRIKRRLKQIDEFDKVLTGLDVKLKSQEVYDAKYNDIVAKDAMYLVRNLRNMDGALGKETDEKALQVHSKIIESHLRLLKESLAKLDEFKDVDSSRHETFREHIDRLCQGVGKLLELKGEAYTKSQQKDALDAVKELTVYQPLELLASYGRSGTLPFIKETVEATLKSNIDQKNRPRGA